MPSSLRILISAFEPFDGRAVNASAAALECLVAEPPPGIEITPVLLPVVGVVAPRRLVAAIRRHRPDAVVALGEAGGNAAIAVERIAVNLRDYPIADNAGKQPRDRPVVKDGPLALSATVPVKKMVDAIRAEGVPAQVSLSAGSYLCNEVMYAMLHGLQHGALHGSDGEPPIPAGFVHVPLLPEQIGASSPRPSMGAETVARALRAALRRL